MSKSNIQVPITSYIESVNNPYGLFRTLDVMHCCRDNGGEIELYCGNKSVVFPLIEGGVKRKLKCYFKKTLRSGVTSQYLSNIDSQYLAKESWLKDEIYVYDIYGNSSYRDVSIADWQEGTTLNCAINRYAILEDRTKLEWLYRQFIDLSLWLLGQEWAHGDIKPENIIVTEDRLVLIDLDALYIPAFKGERTDEIGTPGYQHPKRNTEFFNKNIDDYSIALIATILGSLTIDPTIYDKDMSSDCCMFLPIDIINNRSQKYEQTKQLLLDRGEFALYQLSETLLSPTPAIEDLHHLISNLTLNGVKIEESDQDLIVFNKGSRWGYMNESEVTVIEPIFDTAHEFHDGVAAVNLCGGWRYIDRGGRQILNCKWANKVKHFSNGFAAVEVDGKWGYIDKNGEMVIDAQYEMAGNMHKNRNVALVKLSGKYGYIDSNGGWVIEPTLEYEDALKVFDTHE